MRFLDDESGSALVEFAAFLALLVLIFVGVVDYSMEIQQAMQVQEAATAGASYGAIPGNESDLVGMKAAAVSAAPGVHGFSANATNLWTCSPGGASVTSSTMCPGSVTPSKYVVVTTAATVPVMLAYVGMPANLALHGSATFRVPWSL
jgi:Flp pilus assembly protein TadG